MTTLFAEQNPQSFKTAPRHLTDDVLQSAEEAVLANSVSAAAVLLPQDHFAPGSGDDVTMSHRMALARYVADKPGRSALAAALVGAVLAGLMRQAWMRRR